MLKKYSNIHLVIWQSIVNLREQFKTFKILFHNFNNFWLEIAPPSPAKLLSLTLSPNPKPRISSACSLSPPPTTFPQALPLFPPQPSSPGWSGVYCTCNLSWSNRFFSTLLQIKEFSVEARSDDCREIKNTRGTPNDEHWKSSIWLDSILELSQRSRGSFTTPARLNIISSSQILVCS